MRFNLLVSTSQINSESGKLLGTGSVEGLGRLAEIMVECGIKGDLYDLPNGSRSPTTASPFSLNNGFALTTDELDLFKIPELALDVEFLTHIRQLDAIHRQYYSQNRTVSYALKRTLLPWILEKCYSLFHQSLSACRKSEFDDFRELASYWLEDYARYEVYKEQRKEIDLGTSDGYTRLLTEDFINTHKDRIDFHRYVQFLCFEQRKKIHSRLKTMDIGLIINLPFGVEFDSADVFFHPEVFESDVQVGCSPEPEHGYPEQAWGVAVYKEQSEGLYQYLTTKMNWLSQLGDGVFLDHMVGWCGQYVVPLIIPVDGQYPYGRFLTEDHEERKENLRWFLDVIAQSGLQIRGEVAGDGERVIATREVIEEYLGKGKRIGAMAIPRWESQQNRLLPLSQYLPSTLMMVETHDTSTLLQYLLNKKGYDNDFESPQRILEFCNRVIGLPFFQIDIPLELQSCSEEFWFELCRRLCQGSPSTDMVFTMPGLISLLSSAYRSPTIENNINVKPGTSGAVGNGWRNWSYFSPPVEAMTDDPQLKQALQNLGTRTFIPFDYFHFLQIKDLNDSHLSVIFSKPVGRQIVYQGNDRCWKVLPISAADLGSLELELLIANTGQDEIWERVNLTTLIDLDRQMEICFQDLNAGRECYSHQTQTLRDEHLFVRLQPGQIHHFLVYFKDRLQRIVLPDQV